MNCTSYDIEESVRDSRDLILAEHAGNTGLLLPCMSTFLLPELLGLAVMAAAFAESLQLPFCDAVWDIEAAKRPARADDEEEDDDDEDEEDDDEVADEDEDEEDEEDEDEDEDDDDEEEEEDEFEESESGFDDDDDDDEDEDFDDE